MQSQPCCLGIILGYAMVDELSDRFPIGDHKAIKAPLTAQDIRQLVAAALVIAGEALGEVGAHDRPVQRDRMVERFRQIRNGLFRIY